VLGFVSVGDELLDDGLIVAAEHDETDGNASGFADDSIVLVEKILELEDRR